MNEYHISFKSSAAKEFRKLPLAIKERIRDAVNRLTENPRPSRVVKLKGDEQLFRIRVVTTELSTKLTIWQNEFL